MTSDFDYDQLVGRLRGLLISLDGVLSQAEAAEVGEFIEHAELGEALRTLAWIVVDEGKQISSQESGELQALANFMGTSGEMPDGLAGLGLC